MPCIACRSRSSLALVWTGRVLDDRWSQQLPAGDVDRPAIRPGRACWEAASSAADEPEFAWVEVAADCQTLTFTDAEKTSVEHKTLSLVSTVAGDFLAITDADGKLDCLGKDPKDCGFPIERYVREGEQIRLYAANHRAVHEAIAAGEITGLTQIGNRDDKEAAKPEAATKPKPRQAAGTRAELTYQNLITGSPEQIAQWFVEHPGYFDAEPWLVLDREKTDTRPKHAEVKK